MKNRMAFYKEKFMEYSIRKMTVSEYPMLNDFLYEAIFIPDGIEPPPRNIITSPESVSYTHLTLPTKA